jgi:transcriptional regulator of acetoin/glycerol metabolism
LASGSIAFHDNAGFLDRIFEQSMRELDRSWEAFLGGASRETLAARSPIIDSWERCRAAQVNLSIANAPLLNIHGFEERRRENRSLLHASADTLADAARMLHNTDAIMLVTDAEGIVLDVAGDTAATRAGMDIALSQGGDWKEDSAGTNGIGVALATAKPMLVHAGEHYCQRMKEWSCAAVPISSPLDGSLAGILNLSARSQDANGNLVSLAVFNAHRIELALAHQAETLRARLLEAALERRITHDHGLLLLDSKGRLTYASDLAARLLRDRLHPPAEQLISGQRVFLPSETVSDSLIPGIANDWIEPVYFGGEVGGYMVTVPSAPSAANRRRREREGDESDPKRSSFQSIVGHSPQLRAAMGRAKKIARLNMPVLIEGETGVGKELFARAIHGNGGPGQGPFVTFNCGAISKELIASELFGYAKGAFTGASSEGRKGRFELADGGTLCLDEIGELALDLQSYLLRVLEEGAVTRIGENTIRHVNVRVIAMTNRDLREDVAAGRFRRDLLHRLAIVTISVPPLRDREGDIETLIAHFAPELAQKHGCAPISFTPAALEQLKRYDWPGNVRELRNTIENATVFADGGTADIDILPPHMTEPASAGSTPAKHYPIRDERQEIEQAVIACGGNISAACKALGISRSTLYRRMARNGIDRAILTRTTQDK